MMTEFNTQAVEDKANWEMYQKWSDDSEAEKNGFINDQNALIMSSQAKESANKQQVQTLIENLAKLASEIAATETSIKELTRMRSEERAQFEAALADITKTITAVDKATEILEGHYSADQATLAEIRARVQMALTTSGMQISSTAQKSVEQLASLLQSTVSRREPDYLNIDGKGAYDKYDSQAGGHGVMGMLSDLRAQLETQRQEMVQKENESQRQYEETKAAKDADLAEARKQTAEKTETQAKCEATIENCCYC
jgi:DNA repair exonuclease SbcCD ATPase subunit